MRRRDHLHDLPLYVLCALSLASLFCYVGVTLRGHDATGFRELTLGAFAATFGYARRDNSLTTLQIIEAVKSKPPEPDAPDEVEALFDRIEVKK